MSKRSEEREAAWERERAEWERERQHLRAQLTHAEEKRRRQPAVGYILTRPGQHDLFIPAANVKPPGIVWHETGQGEPE